MITVIISSNLYGTNTHSNLIQGLPVTNLLYFDILIVTLQLFLSTIGGQCTLFQDIEDKLGIPTGKHYNFKKLKSGIQVSMFKILTFVDDNNEKYTRIAVYEF